MRKESGIHLLNPLGVQRVVPVNIRLDILGFLFMFLLCWCSSNHVKGKITKNKGRKTKIMIGRFEQQLTVVVMESFTVCVHDYLISYSCMIHTCHHWFMLACSKLVNEPS